MLAALAKNVYENEKFQDEYQRLALSYFQNIIADGENTVDVGATRRLAEAALILATSADSEHQEAAYTIAARLQDVRPSDFAAMPNVLSIVLNRIRNFPALELAKKIYNLSPDFLPSRVLSESEINSSNYEVFLPSGKKIFTEFQFELWHALLNGSSVVVSAPTSAGKSYVMLSYLHRLCGIEDVKNIAYIVPTRALISQVSEDIQIECDGPSDFEIISNPIGSEVDLPKKAIYVVTQERMQYLLMGHSALSFDAVFIDEIQGLSDGPRGVLLSSVIGSILERGPDTQIVMAGPNIAEGDRLSRIFGIEIDFKRTSAPTVKQNLIFLDLDEIDARTVSVSVSHHGNKIFVGERRIDNPSYNHKAKLINLPLEFYQGKQTLIYAFGPAESEDLAFGVRDGLTEKEDPELEKLSYYVKDVVHPKFQLSQDVKFGVGYHYGRLPSIVRAMLEDAFKDGGLDFLVTTSTLLHGVNLPAKNLFIHNPQKGQGGPLTSQEFWNLAGRAGRLGQEFEGNVFLIDYGEWDSNPIDGNKETEVIPSFQEHVSERTADFVQYIKDPDAVPEIGKQDELENSFVKVYVDYINGKLEETLARNGIERNDDRAKDIREALDGVAASTTLPSEIVVMSPSVSVHRQQALYDWIQQSLRKKGPQYVIPKHPLASGAYQSLLAAFKRCHGSIARLPKENDSHKYFAVLALKWMKGDPLRMIIDESYRQRAKTSNPSWPSVIRAVLQEIENDLRFQYVRMMSCYNAVLVHALRREGYERYVESIPNIPLYLEVGACTGTMTNFLNLGLSRYSATKVGSLARRQDLSVEEARSWIRRQDVDALDLPQRAIDELKRAID